MKKGSSVHNFIILITLEILIRVAPKINVPPINLGRNNKHNPSNKRTPLLKKDDFHAIWYLKSKFSSLQKVFYQN